MLWNRKISAYPWLDEYEVASYLPDGLPSGFLKCLGRFFAGNIGKFAHELKGDDDRLASRLVLEL